MVALIEKKRREIERDPWQLAKVLYPQYRFKQFHRDWFYQSMGDEEDLCLGPRNFGKTTVRGVIRSIAKLIRNPNIQLGICSDTGFQSSHFAGEIKAHLDQNQLLRAMYPHLAPGTPWTGSEFNIAGATEIRKGSSVMAVSYGGAMTGFEFNDILVDDVVDFENSRTKYQREKLKDWLGMTLIPMLKKGGNLHWSGCLSTGTKILKEDGTWESIEKIKLYEKVYSFDDNKLVSKRVEAVIPQGIDEVFQIRTERSKIKANSKHPFLVINPTEKIKYPSREYDYITDYEFKWKPVSELKKNDMIVTLKKLERGVDRISNSATWLFGFMVGDGWITKNIRDNGRTKKKYSTWKICFAKGVDEKLNHKVLSLFKDIFDVEFKLTEGGYYVATSKEIRAYLHKLGLKKGAKNKDIPEWVFKSSMKNRQCFIKGLLDADGWVIKKSFTSRGIESSSEKLIKNLDLLCRTSGYLTSNIYHRERISQPPNSPKPIQAESWYMNINYNNRTSEYRLMGKAKEKFPFNIFRFETIKEIKSIGEKEIWDLTIADTHNFIAEGFVTHNTRYHQDDYYGILLKQGIKTNETSHKAVIDERTSLWPEEYPIEWLMKKKEKVGTVIFNAQWQNDTKMMAEGVVILRKWFKYVNMNEVPEKVRLIQICDLAISKGETANYFVESTFGLDMKKGDIYFMDMDRNRYSWHEQKEAIRRNNDKWKSKRGQVRIYIEGNQYQIVLAQEMDKHIDLSITSFTTVQDKVTALRGISPKFENGKFYFVNSLPGLDIIEDELCAFPDGEYDDICDTVSGIQKVMSERRPSARSI